MPNNDEKMFGAEIPVCLIEAFTDQIAKDGFLKKKAVEGAIRLFLSLPLSARSMIVSGGSGAGEELREVMREIAEDVIEQGRLVAQKQRQKRKGR